VFYVFTTVVAGIYNWHASNLTLEIFRKQDGIYLWFIKMVLNNSFMLKADSDGTESNSATAIADNLTNQKVMPKGLTWKLTFTIV